MSGSYALKRRAVCSIRSEYTSKQEVFDKALEKFMAEQEKRFSTLMTKKSDAGSPRMRLERLLECYYEAMDAFKRMAKGNVHWTVLYALHDLTVQAMLPHFKQMILDFLSAAGREETDEVKWLAPFLLKGISGLLHEPSFLVLSKEAQLHFIRELFSRILQISFAVFE